MNATSIVLLAGVCSLWVAFGFLAAYLNRTRRTLEKLEQTLDEVQKDLCALSPVVSGTLEEIERTGQELSRTSREVRLLTERLRGNQVSVSLISGAVSYLPAAVAAVRLFKPLFARKKG